MSAAAVSDEVTRCQAAHAEDTSRCEGPLDAVRVVDRLDVEVTGCVRHGAVLLGSLERGRVYPGPGSTGGEAIEVYTQAQHLPPFAFERAVDRVCRSADRSGANP